MTPRELAAAIRKGAMLVDEDGTSSGCVLGTAYIGVTGKNLLRDNRPYINLLHTRKIAADALGIPVETAHELEKMHLGGQRRLEIADWLDTLEPETKPDDKAAFEKFKAKLLEPVTV